MFQPTLRQRTEKYKLDKKGELQKSHQRNKDQRTLTYSYTEPYLEKR